MASKRERPPEERLKLGRRVCGWSQTLVTACCIAIVVLLRSATVSLLVAGWFVLYTVFNYVLWRTIKRQALSAMPRSPFH